VRRAASSWVGIAAAVVALVAGSDGAQAREKLARFPAGADRTPASRYAALGRDSCLRELRRRGIAFRSVDSARGVLAPVRLLGKVGGVRYRTDLDPSAGRRAPWEVFDCRLVLALDDFSTILRAHEVVEVRIFSAWRPPAKSWPKGKVARRHPGALALDARVFRKQDGSELDVDAQWGGAIGAETCGAGAAAPEPPSPQARELRSIVCEAADARIFHSILTPNYDRPHHNHLHLEVTAEVKWFIVR
jgi:hypothetical protein